MDEYEAQFMEEHEGSARAAVKRLTGKLYSELVEATINAPDWLAIPLVEPFIS
jgi:hypothetical protein